MLDAERKKSTGVAYIEFSNPQMSINFLNWIKETGKDVFENNVVLSEFAIQDAKTLIKLNNRKKNNNDFKNKINNNQNEKSYNNNNNKSHNQSQNNRNNNNTRNNKTKKIFKQKRN